MVSMVGILGLLLTGLSFWSSVLAQSLPSEDAFYIPPSDFASEYALGEIIRYRVAPSALKLNNYKQAFQIMYRSSNSQGNAEAAITTLVVPENPDSTKLVSYQVSEGSACIDCCPSYTLQTTSHDKIISDFLANGYYTVIPDYEGPSSSYTVGLQEGKATLDSIRAALKSAEFSNLQSNSTVVLWGYSSGSIPTRWAAQLQGSYAPELNISGTVMGGVIVNVTGTILSANNSTNSGFIPAAMLGIASQYPEFNETLYAQLISSNSSKFLTALSQCSGDNNKEFANENIFSYFADHNNILYEPSIQDVLQQLAMGSYTLESPMYIYQGENDEFASTTRVDATVFEYCAYGANVTYVKGYNESHADEASAGASNAFSWLSSRLEGKTVSPGCTTSYTSRSATTTPILQYMTYNLPYKAVAISSSSATVSNYIQRRYLHGRKNYMRDEMFAELNKRKMRQDLERMGQL